MKLLDKVAVMTGVAGGLGRVIAAKLANEGATVVASDLENSNGASVVESIVANGGQAIFVATDITKEEQINNLVATAIDKYGKVDIMINCAAILTPTINFEDTTEEYFDKIIKVNLKGVFLGIKAVIPHMKERRSGSIINIASVGGMRPRAGMVPYCASKAGVIMMTNVAARELADFGVRVNVLAPGPIDHEGVTPEMREIFLKDIPLHRIAPAAEIAAAIVYLASDDAAQMTGVCLPIDGGRSLK